MGAGKANSRGATDERPIRAVSASNGIELSGAELERNEARRDAYSEGEMEDCVRLLGLDHADIRVTSIAAVEPFYDTLLPVLGLARKTEAHVAADGEWHDVDEAHPRNAIEYNTPVVPGSPGWFVGFIEDPATVPSATRIAFGLDAESGLRELEALVLRAGGRIVEWSSDGSYPALFFEDPAGTRLEICARRPRA